MKFFRQICSIILIIAMITAVGCKKQGSAVDMTYFKTSIHVQTHDKPLSQQTISNLNDLFLSLEEEFSFSKDNSLVNKINRASVNEKIALSERGLEVLSLATNYYNITDKKFNPAVYSLSELWQFAPTFNSQNFTIPNQEDIDKILSSNATDFSLISIDEDYNLTKTNADVKIDLGGILKGYATDLAVKILKADGHDSGYISVGGSSLNLLNVDELGIRHPRPTNELQNVLTVNCKGLSDLPVSTSGDYERYHQVGYNRYSHIIDGKTGYPTDTGVISATVIGKVVDGYSGAFGDAITTAICLCAHAPSDQNSELVKFLNKLTAENPDLSVFVFVEQGDYKALLTNELDERFTLLDTTYKIEKLNPKILKG